MEWQDLRGVPAPPHFEVNIGLSERLANALVEVFDAIMLEPGHDGEPKNVWRIGTDPASGDPMKMVIQITPFTAKP